MATLLVVDDEPGIAMLVAELIVGMGHTALLATNGREALAVARRGLPVLILSDVMMPYMDGYALLNAIRAERAFAAIPFVLMSAAFDQPPSRSDVTYLHKPFDLIALEELLTRLLNSDGAL